MTQVSVDNPVTNDVVCLSMQCVRWLASIVLPEKVVELFLRRCHGSPTLRAPEGNPEMSSATVSRVPGNVSPALTADDKSSPIAPQSKSH